MVGATAQLAASGAADVYLSARPQITYFKQVWRRYTQFALESVEQSWTGDADFGKKATVMLARTGDLVTEVWLQVKLPDLATLNHITGAARSATQPVITRARNTRATTLEVDAYTCEGVSTYALVCLSGTSPVRTARLAADGGMTLTTPTSVSVVTLVPMQGGPPLTASQGSDVDGVRSWTTGPLLQNVSYYVSCTGAPVSHVPRDAVVRVATSSAQTVSFAIPDVTTQDYKAQVSAIVGGVPVASLQEDVLKAKWCNSVGHALVSMVEWELGGTSIARHTGEHYDMWCELTEPEEKRAGYSDMIGRYLEYDMNDDAKSSGASRTLFVPMRFSFNLTPSNALPLVAIPFQDCKLNFEFRSFWDLIKTNVSVRSFTREPSMESCRVFATYVFLSQDERMRFVEMPHEYLIEQVQAQVENVAPASTGAVNRKIKLALNHPVKEIMWAYQATSNTTRDPLGGNNWFDYDIPSRGDEEIFEEANIQMNGHDRFVKRPAKYFRLVQPWMHHSRCPSKKVHCYSFALHPESWENPSGAANFSRIDTAHLNLVLNPNIVAGRVRIHAIGYNVLRITQGLAGLAYAN